MNVEFRHKPPKQQWTQWQPHELSIHSPVGQLLHYSMRVVSLTAKSGTIFQYRKTH